MYDQKARRFMIQQYKDLGIREALGACDDDRFYEALQQLYDAGRGDAINQASKQFADYSEFVANDLGDDVTATALAIVGLAVRCAETGENFPHEEIDTALKSAKTVMAYGKAVN